MLFFYDWGTCTNLICTHSHFHYDVHTCGCTGADRLKEALNGIGLKSGGTLRERAARLYLTKGVPLSQLDRKHFAKGVVVPTVATGAGTTAAGAGSKGGGDAEAAAKRMEEGALQVCTATTCIAAHKHLAPELALKPAPIPPLSAGVLHMTGAPNPLSIELV